MQGQAPYTVTVLSLFAPYDMTSSLSQRIADARRNHVTLDTLSPEQTPADASAAYAIQHEILSLNGAAIGGFKIPV